MCPGRPGPSCGTRRSQDPELEAEGRWQMWPPDRLVRVSRRRPFPPIRDASTSREYATEVWVLVVPKDEPGSTEIAC